MIIVRLIGGLGNQMFQYALGRRLASERATVLKLDTTWFKSDAQRSYQLDRWKISAEIASTHEINNLMGINIRGRKSKLYSAIQSCIPYYYRSTIQERCFAYDPAILKVPRHSYLVGYWQSEKYFSPITSMLHEEFNFKGSPSSEYQVWEKEIKKRISIGLHVRRGDYANNSRKNKMHGTCSLAYYEMAINHIREKFPAAAIFVFSDDMAWARQNLNNYASINFVNVNNVYRDQEELLLMNLCNHHIIANSSYSWWGAWLGTKPGQIVVAPQKWFNDEALDTRDLIPEGWVRL